jgi:hypothetical protein
VSWAFRAHQMLVSTHRARLRKHNSFIHVGVSEVTAFAALVNAQVTVLEGAVHSLPKEYVASLLDTWLI